MRIGLTTRVVLTVVTLAVGVVALDAFVTRRAFQARFLDYIGEQEREQLEVLADALARHHAEHGSLDALTDRARLMRVLFTALTPDARSDQPDGPRAPALPPLDREHRPPPPERRDPPAGFRDPPPDLRLRLDPPVVSREGMQEGPPDGPGDARHRDHRRAERSAYRRLTTLVPRLEITLADGRVLLEPRLDIPERLRQLQQLVEVDGEVVARLSLLPAREIVRERDRRFSREHMAAIWWIAAAAAVVASLVGWLLARRLVGPVQAVAAGARALAEGNHDVQLPADRGDELGALARDFNRLASTLAATSRARERWMADVAHELRTPVAVLRGEIDALRDGVRPMDPAALDSLDAEIGRLSRLIDDLHDLTLADAGALDYRFEEADLTELVDDACLRFGDRLSDAGLDLQWTRPQDPVPVRADPRRLDQLLANLLENAVRYTDAPGPVRVTVTMEGTRVRLRVEDGPPGVDETERPRLFERFHRPDASRARVSGGAGLGLAIAERIVRAHEGTIEAHESDLGGLAIDVTLPGGGSTR